MTPRRQEVTGIPERLATFTEADWSGEYLERLRAWHEARVAWSKVNGWPTDRLAMLAEYSDLRRIAEGAAPWIWGRSPSQMRRLGFGWPGRAGKR